MKKFLTILIFLTTLISQGWSDTEPNDSCAQGETWTTLTARGQSSSTMSGSVSSSNQNDYYKIVLSTSGSLQITGTSVQNSNFYLLNSSCTQLASAANTKNPSITYSASAGTYYLQVNRRNNDTTYSNLKAYLGYVDGERSFAPIYSSNTRGGVKIIGNSNLCKTNSSGVCIEPDTGDNNDGTAERSANKISFTDLDGDGTTFNSTSADLNLPVGSKIVFAKLFWQGYQDKRSNPINQVKFKKSGNSYQTVTATQTDTLNSGDNYQSSIDITNLLDVNNPNGTYFVANIAADVYADNTTQDVDDYAAWALFVVYENPSESLKNVTLWDGYDSISSGSTTITASGFRTPLSGAIHSSFLIFSTEGDVQSTGDYIQVNGTNLTNGSNPSNNPFNSTISSGGVNVTSRNPNYANTLGIDVDDFNVSSLLSNNQTSATIRIGTSGDAFYVSAFAFSTEIYSPAIGNFDKNVSVTYASNQTCGTDKDLRGATLNYEMSFENTGSEAASTVRVYDDFQSNGILDYLDMTQTTVPTVQLLSGTAASTIACDKNTTGIYCDFNRINIGTKYKINFSTKVKSSLIIADDTTLNNTANAHYYNASTGEEITQLASSNMEVAGGICAVLPVANYRLDECLWSGANNEILDSSGNGVHGKSVNNPLKFGGAICTGGKFKGTSTNTNITVENNSHLNLANELSISVWVNPASWPTSDLRTIVSKDTNYEFHLNTNGQVFWWWGNGNFSGASSIALNTWTHITLTYKNGEQKIYINGVEDASATYTGTLPQNSLPFYIGVDYNYPSRTFDGLIDEVKIFDRALTPLEVSAIYSNESSGNNFNGSIRTCPDCAIIPDPANTFDAWDSFRSLSDRNISTKIVNKPFTLTVASMDETNTAFQDFNGTLCARLIDTAGTNLTSWNQLSFASEQTKTTTFTLNRAIGGSDNARVRLMWKKDAPSSTACDALTDTNTTVASDRFSVRPASFAIASPNAVAGVDFNVTFTAPDFSGSPSISYNESVPGSFDIAIGEHNPLCPIGTFSPLINSFSFVNGTKIFTTRYSEVGVLDVNITDLTKACGAQYANIDCDDADVAGFYSAAGDLPIGLTQAQITIKPHHFDVTGTLSNFAGGNFTYLSDDLNMSAQLDLNITAKNGEGNTTTNYSSACYAKNTNLTLDHSTVPSPLTKILYTETLSTLNTTVLKDDSWVLSLNSTLFNSGSVAPNIDFNFDRSPTKPLNPFDFNITSATAADVDITGSTTPLGDTTFVYGRVHAYDITTNTSPVNAPIEFEVYSTLSSGFVSGMPQNVLKWYRNLDHDTAAHGNVILGGFNAGATDSAIVTSASPADGLQLIGVTSIIDQTVHLKISPWLWYSLNPLKTYNYGTDCTQHPCFNYDYTDASVGVQGVNSGTFQGSDFQMTPAKNITNKGVKLFR